MPITVERTLYQFAELSDAAKETARDWWRTCENQSGDSFWSECTISDAVEIAALMGIDINTRPVPLMGGGTRHDPCVYWSGFSSQGDGACFEATLGYRKGATAAVKAYAPKDRELHRIAAAWTQAQRHCGFKAIGKVKHSGRYYHEFCTSFEFEHSEKGWDYERLDAEAEAALIEPCRDLMKWIYRQLESEYEYQMSDEQIDEAMAANEYTFTEDGKREDA
jgi:hypothetical protein